MESFMYAPVGVLEERAGDAELLFTPHHVQSIPACGARGKRSSANRKVRHILKSYATTADALTVVPAPLYPALGTFLARLRHASTEKTWRKFHDSRGPGGLVVSGLGRLRLPFSKAEGFS